MPRMSALQRAVRHRTAVEQARQRGAFAASKTNNPHHLPADPVPRETPSGLWAYRDRHGVSLPYLKVLDDGF